jgi:hypothetical protein
MAVQRRYRTRFRVVRSPRLQHVARSSTDTDRAKRLLSASAPCCNGGQPAGNRPVLTANAASIEPGKVERLLRWRRFSPAPRLSSKTDSGTNDQSKGHDEEQSPAAAVGGGRPRGRCGPASAAGGVLAGQDGLRCTRRHARGPDTRGGCHLAAQDRSAFANVEDFSPDESRETERPLVLVLGSLTPPVGVEALHNAPRGRGVGGTCSMIGPENAT